MKDTYIHYYIFKGGPYDFVTTGGPYKTTEDALDAVRSGFSASDICVLAELWTDVTNPTPICWYMLNDVKSPIGKSYIVRQNDPIPAPIMSWFDPEAVPDLETYKFDTSTYVKIPAITKQPDTPIKLCIDHIYSGDYEGKTVVITSPDHCSICNSPPTWDDVARMFLTASTRLTEIELYVSDEECLSETNDLVKKAFVSYFKKVHPDVLEEFLKTALEKIK